MAKALLKLGLTQDLVNRDLIRSILDTDDNGMPHNEYVSFWESLAKPATATHFLIELVTRLIDTERQFVKLLKKGIDVERRARQHDTLHTSVLCDPVRVPPAEESSAQLGGTPNGQSKHELPRDGGHAAAGSGGPRCGG